MFCLFFWTGYSRLKFSTRSKKIPDLISTSQPELLDILLVFKSRKPITYFHLQNRFPFSPPKEIEFAKVIFAHVWKDGLLKLDSVFNSRYFIISVLVKKLSLTLGFSFIASFVAGNPVKEKKIFWHLLKTITLTLFREVITMGIHSWETEFNLSPLWPHSCSNPYEGQHSHL